MIDHSINTKRKRHLAGGILLSVSLFFGSLAITIFTLKHEDEEEKEYDDEQKYIY